MTVTGVGEGGVKEEARNETGVEVGAYSRYPSVNGLGVGENWYWKARLLKLKDSNKSLVTLTFGTNGTENSFVSHTHVWQYDT